MSETPVRKVPETNDPASAPPRPSTSPQHQQQIRHLQVGIHAAGIVPGHSHKRRVPFQCDQLAFIHLLHDEPPRRSVLSRQGHTAESNQAEKTDNVPKHVNHIPTGTFLGNPPEEAKN